MYTDLFRSVRNSDGWLVVFITSVIYIWYALM